MEALLFLLLLLFLDPHNSEQAAAGAALLREGGRERQERLGGGWGGVSFPGCAAAVQTRPHQGALKSAVLDQFLRDMMGGMGEVVSTGPPPLAAFLRSPRWHPCCCRSRARLRLSLMRWSFKSLMSRDGELNPAGRTGMEGRWLDLTGGGEGGRH